MGKASRQLKTPVKSTTDVSNLRNSVFVTSRRAFYPLKVIRNSLYFSRYSTLKMRDGESKKISCSISKNDISASSRPNLMIFCSN
jgi:hypothetical protein